MENNSPIQPRVTLEETPYLILQVQAEIKEIAKTVSQLIKKFQPIKPEELMTREEVRNYFKCDMSTIHNWTKKGKIKAHYICGKVYYKRSEIENVTITF